MTPPKVTKITIHNNSSLDSFYEQTLRYLHEKYHSHPTSIPDIKLTDEEKARQSYYDQYGYGGGSSDGLSVGKTVF